MDEEYTAYYFMRFAIFSSVTVVYPDEYRHWQSVSAV
jgi:hypothetical protein